MADIQTDYIVSQSTIAVLPYCDLQYQSKVIDQNGEFHTSKTPIHLIKESCLEYGSTYEGRRKAVMHHMNITQKVPIPIDPLNNIYAFPTHSPTQFEGMWVMYHHVRSIAPLKEKSLMTFKNGQTLDIDVSLYTLEKQIQRTAFCMVRFSMQHSAFHINQKGDVINGHY